MKRSIKIISVLMLFPFFGKSMFLDSGIFAQSLYRMSLICHCNHNSVQEIHSETRLVTGKRIVCHLSSNRGVHECACPKKRNVAKVLHSQLMNPNILMGFKFELQNVSDIANLTKQIVCHLSNGFFLKLIKPPNYSKILT